MQRLIILMQFLKRFGPFYGLTLCIKIFIGRVKNIRVPSYRYSISLRPDSSDISTFNQVFLFDEYNFKFNEKPKLIIDGGANIGLFAIKMKNEYPDSKVICIEPDSENYLMLQKNTMKYNNVFLEHKGLWNKETKLKVFDKYNCGKWGMVVEEDSISGSINAISLNALFKKYSIDVVDILKIDIETSEKQLFSENYDYWIPKVKHIIIELHDWMEPGCSKIFFSAINKSISNYKYSQIGENVIISNLDLIQNPTEMMI